MKNLLLLILRFKDAIIFLLLAFFSLYLTVNFNHLNRVNWLHASNVVGGNIQNKTSSIKGYFNLQEKNDSLTLFNAHLMTDLIRLQKEQQKTIDSLFALQSLISKDSTLLNDSSKLVFKHLIANKDTNALFIPVNIVYNTITSNTNYISIDKGSEDGIKAGSGLVTEKGILGKVISTSNHFSLVKSILHKNNKISAKIKNTNELGSLIWKDKDLNILYLKDIPRHEKIHIGDTIITTEYNSVYPKNHPIGVVSEVTLEENEPFYQLKVKTFEDLGSAYRGYVYTQNLNQEKKSLLIQKDTLP